MVEKVFFGENKNIEFKREMPKKHEKFLKDIIAFSNGTGGKVILGIEDITNVVFGIGDVNPFKLSDDISSMVSDACTPQINPDITIQKLEDMGFLCLIGRDYAPTHAFNLMTDNKIKSAKIQCALFKGTERDVFIDRKEFTGPIYTQIEDAYQFVLKHINMGAEIKGVQRRDVYELPLKAIRERIANSVAHRSYLDDSCIQLAIFDDRIEVLSPGMLYGGLDLNSAKAGKSKCRNSAIADAVYYMRIIEAWGTGIPRIIRQCREYGLKEPLFEEFGDGFKTTIFRKDQNVGSKVENMGNTDQKVSSEFAKYESILRNAGVTKIFIANIEIVYRHVGQEAFKQSDVMEYLNCSKSKAGNMISAMKQAEIIRKVTGLGLGKYQFV